MNKRVFKLGMIAVIVAIFAIMAITVGSAEAQTWKQKFARVSGVAGETVVTGDVVCIAAADGQIYKADADSASLRPAIGVIGKGGLVDTTVEIIPFGVIRA
jgi:hypothetical protein